MDITIVRLFNASKTPFLSRNVLTAVLADDGLVFTGPQPDHNGAILGASDHVAILCDVALRTSHARHDVEMAVDDLQDLG